MATKKQTTTKKTASSGTRKTGSGTSRSKSAAAVRARNDAPQAGFAYTHVIWGAVLLLLAVFSALGCLQVQAILIDWLVTLEAGLLGYVQVLAPVALLAAAIELFCRKRLKRLPLKLVLTLLLPVWISAMVHTLAGTSAFEADLPSTLSAFWSSGIAHTSGGVLGGILGTALVLFASKIGSMIFLLLLLFFSLLLLTDTPLSSFLGRIANRHASPRRERPQRKRAPRTETLPPPEEDDEAPPPPEEEAPPPFEVDAATGEVLDPEPASLLPRRRRRQKSAIDIPLSGEPAASQAPASEEPENEPEPAGQPGFLSGIFPSRHKPLYDTSSSVPAPDEVYARQHTPEPAPAPQADKADEPVIPVSEQRPAPPVTVPVREPVPDEELYRTPPFDLLNAAPPHSKGATGDELDLAQQQLSDTIHSFGIDAEIIGRTCGPSVTRYELRLEQGVKLSTVTNLSGDFALSLGAASVRISPIPGRSSVVGIEVPNARVSPVPLREVLDSKEFRSHKSQVAFAVGRDIGNNNIIGDIARLPHVLIAGTTGSGKSVCINSLLISLLYKSSPKDVRLIMVDPKMVELGIYNGIPHLLIPVVTDPKKAAGALQWAVYEMMRRYTTFSEQGVRDIASYNELAEQEDGLEHMAQVVVVIDELADLMLVAKKEVEESICRVAQMGRAAGMHLVIATQRPSKDVITGLMKANIPSRIAFAVASAIDSRIILDQGGAEKLVGKGDMLFFPLGIDKPIRAQGCLVSDEEVGNVIGFIKENSSANYDDTILAEVEENAKNAGRSSKGASAMNVAFPEPDDGSAAPPEDADDADELLPQAVDVIMETGMASVSMLQRRLKLGYSRAARLVDQMEERGIVGPFEGSKPRKVLITKEQWQERKLQGGQLQFDDLEIARTMSAAADAESGLPFSTGDSSAL